MTPETETPTEYTPTTTEVMAGYVVGEHMTSGAHPAERYAEDFRRWLSTHDREVAARAWGEGAKAAREEDFLADDFVETPNPYRIENGETDA